MVNMRAAKRLVGLLGALLPAVLVAGIPVPVPPTVDSSGLPALGQVWAKANPYRGNADVLEVGGQLFNQGCAVCHGQDAEGDRSPAPDLRGLHAYCNRVAAVAVRTSCEADVDAFYVKSVLEGKTKVGVVHMPGWKGVLSQEQVWAIKSFIESRRP